MLSLPVRGLIAAGGIGLGGIGVWQLTEYMAPRNLQQRLEAEGFKFYSFEEGKDKEGWKGLAKAYRETSESKSDLKFQDLNISANPETEQEGKNLRDKCKGLALKVPSSGEHDEAQDMEKLRTWCVVPFTQSTTPVSA